MYALRPLSAALTGTLAQTRFRALLVGLFSVLALLLAAIGLYGVMAYMVSQRQREIGIRLALGARPAQIAGQILRSGILLTGAGVAAGILIARCVSRLLGNLLYGIGASDFATYLAASGVLLAVALLACWIPGRRATSIDPNQALRS